MTPAADARADTVDLEIQGRVLTEDGVVLRRVAVSDGRVVTVESLSGWSPTVSHDARSTVVQLAEDEVLIPGLVDTHVHVNEPGRTAWEGFATATRAAAAGGVTTLLDMPLNSIPATTSVPALEVKRAAAEGAVAVDVGFWAGAVPESLGRLASLHEEGAYGFKCFLLDSGVPEFPAMNPIQLRAAMTEIAAFDGLLIVHAEDPDVIAAHVVAHTTRYAEFLGSRPPEAETRAIDTVLDAARATGCRTHVVHLSASAALPALAAARADGVRVTVETCPHYLSLAAERIADRQTQFKCCPPIRDAANADRLWQGLVDGVIDFVVSDHSPATADLKLLDEGDFGAAWGGISSLQLGLPLVWTAARERGIALEDVVGWMARRPAEVVGVAGKGRIAVGHPADLVVLAPEERFTVDVAQLRHRNPVSPYDGQQLTGVVRRTYLAGRPVTDDTTAGQLLRRREISA